MVFCENLRKIQLPSGNLSLPKEMGHNVKEMETQCPFITESLEYIHLFQARDTPAL